TTGRSLSSPSYCLETSPLVGYTAPLLTSRVPAMSDKPSGSNKTTLIIVVAAVGVLGLCVCGIGGVGFGLWLPRRAAQREQIEAAAAAKAEKKIIAEAKKPIA